ncbi:MAG: pantetheine-phosphate adenylyltransferase [Ruminococcus sp.]|nr:pantetheine-phosphate adenylyltransferase [Ruminococcus sp.]MCD7773169.1 pantetheine-phosphate adenylyltransferase [Ruminococcus sp.]
MEKIAVCPGSFDPVTFGHLDIIHRASVLFDKVIVLVSVNSTKNTSFSAAERVEMIKKVSRDLPNVEVDTWEGLLAEYCKKRNVCAIVKGLRAVSDFEYEFQQALANKTLYPQGDTIFLTTRSENMYLSSSVVKEIARYGGDISSLVPSEILDTISERLVGNN